MDYKHQEEKEALNFDTSAPEALQWQHHDSTPVVFHSQTEKEAVTATSTSYSPASSYPEATARHELDDTDRRLARKCGLRRRAVLLIALVLLILAVGLGAGLGVGLQSRSTTNTASATPASQTASVVTTTQTSSTTSSTSTPQASGTASTTCPNSNGTQYVASGYTFTIYCNSDIGSTVKTDLGRVYQPTFDACIQSCGLLNSYSKRTDISAVYWVDYDAAAIGTCWCLGNTTRAMGASVVSAPQNDLAWISS